jgi:hypothetical protein
MVARGRWTAAASSRPTPRWPLGPRLWGCPNRSSNAPPPPQRDVVPTKGEGHKQHGGTELQLGGHCCGACHGGVDGRRGGGGEDPDGNRIYDGNDNNAYANVGGDGGDHD